MTDSEQLDDVCRTLVREWWATYRVVLQEPSALTAASMRLNAITEELESLGVIVSGRSMTRTGAEELAKDVDDYKKMKRIYPYC